VADAAVSDEPQQIAAQIERAQTTLAACGVEGVVASVKRLKGQSHVSWRVERLDAPPVVLRLEPKQGILPPYDLPSEARLLRSLHRAGIPVPEVLGMSDTLGPSDDSGGSGIVLEWIEGEVLIKHQVDAHAARAYCETLRRIHTLDWQAAGLGCLPLPPESGPAIREREEIARRLRAFRIEELPHIRRLRDALDGRTPAASEPALVHCDVNFGNFILQPRDRDEKPRVVAVLDWEQAHLGDPLLDWGRLAVEDLLGNLDLSEGARQVMKETLESYGRSDEDLHYWTLHQLYKHASATGALLVLRDWDINQIAAMYTEPTERLLSS
jgi:aminoglycoside phosphotransferase (APT) family kinase protein